MVLPLVVTGSQNEWEQLVVSAIHTTRNRLNSISLLIEQDRDSTLVLLRSLFELAVTLDYIDKDRDARLAKYTKRLRNLSEGGDERLHVFERTLPSLKRRCEEVGSWAMNTYNSSALYQYTSDATHSGAWTMFRSRAEGPNDLDKAMVLAMAVDYLLRVARHPAASASEEFRNLWERRYALLKMLDE